MKFHKLLALLIFATAPHIHTTIPHLEMAKEATRAYYEDGQYERELADIVATVQSKFCEPATHERQIVIFDVDEVALSSYRFFKAHDFGSVWATWCAFLLKNHLPANMQMHQLYWHFKNLGYNIIFLTSRTNTFHEATHNNLIAAGYTDFHRLITRPAQEHMKGHEFKELERTKLVQEGYEIVCCIDDLEKNLEGAHVGHAVKIPNWLYS